MRVPSYLLTLWNTISAPKYYLEILNKPLRFSLQFFWWSYLWLSIIASLFFATTQIPQWRHSLQNNLQLLAQNYPANLEINWDGQKLSSQPTDPIVIPYPNNFPQGQLPAQLLLLNTQVNDVQSALNNQPAVLLVATAQKVFVSDLAGGWSDLALAETPGFEQPFHISAQNLHQYITATQTVINQVLFWSQVFFPLIFLIFNGAVTLLSVMFDSLLIYFFVQLLGRPLPYRKIVQISLHIAIVAQLLQIFFQRLLPDNSLNMYNLTYWAYMIYVLFTLRGVKQVFLVKSQGK